jgi:hypothetical protein
MCISPKSFSFTYSHCEHRQPPHYLDFQLSNLQHNVRPTKSPYYPGPPGLHHTHLHTTGPKSYPTPIPCLHHIPPSPHLKCTAPLSTNSCHTPPPHTSLHALNISPALPNSRPFPNSRNSTSQSHSLRPRPQLLTTQFRPCPRYCIYRTLLTTATFYTTARLIPLLESWALSPRTSRWCGACLVKSSIGTLAFCLWVVCQASTSISRLHHPTCTLRRRPRVVRARIPWISSTRNKHRRRRRRRGGD